MKRGVEIPFSFGGFEGTVKQMAEESDKKQSVSASQSDEGCREQGRRDADTRRRGDKKLRNEEIDEEKHRGAPYHKQPANTSIYGFSSEIQSGRRIQILA